MNNKVKKEVISKLRKIENGQFDCDDIRLLFIDLRDSLSPIDKSNEDIAKINDLFHFCAHPNARREGKVFKISKKIAKDLVDCFTKGGKVVINLFDVDVLETLTVIFNILDIPYTKDRLERQREKIMLCVYKFLDGIEINIDNNSIEHTSIVCDPINNYVFISYKMKPFNNTIGNLTISGSPTMRFRLM